MKKVFTLSVILFMTWSISAQAPQRLSYQCVVRNANGGLVINQTVGLRVSIIQSTPSGTVVFQETYNPKPSTNTNGLLTVEIGSGVASTGTFSSINWATICAILVM